MPITGRSAAYSAGATCAREIIANPSESGCRRAVDALYRTLERSNLTGSDGEIVEPVACKFSCDYCCHLRVLVTPPELLLIMSNIELLYEGVRDQIDLKISCAARLAAGRSDENFGMARIPCAFLTEHICAVYSFRPLECRGYSSMNVDSCRSAYKQYSSWNVPLVKEKFAEHKYAQAALIHTLCASGIPTRPLELNTAAKFCRDNPHALDEWLAGTDVFEAVAISERDEDVIALLPWSGHF